MSALRVDVVTIFPDYLAPLSLSLPGRAQDNGLLDVRVHDLRAYTTDRHRTVDDTPYGGGAGMVMKPEPWGEALDSLLTDDSVLVVPTPSGRPLTQALARELAGRQHLVFACGRYEGIDQRVIDEYADRVVEISIGDYVLNGGEAAALVITEAVVRLLPGFMGNAESLVEESHEQGLLEYPSYTKPAQWRGREVPAVLLSGDHGAIARWRHRQAVERTALRRPDLAHASSVHGEWEIVPAVRADAPELLVLQLACWVDEARANDDLDVPALRESLADVEQSLQEWDVYVVRRAGRLVGAVRGRLDDDPDGRGRVWDIGRLMVAPDLRGQGLGGLLLQHIEQAAPAEATSYTLFTGTSSDASLRRYKRAGYRVQRILDGRSGPVVLTKPRRRGTGG